MFLYKDKPITAVALGRGAIAMKIVGGKSERKYQRYNTVDQRISLRGLAVGDV